MTMKGVWLWMGPFCLQESMAVIRVPALYVHVAGFTAGKRVIEKLLQVALLLMELRLTFQILRMEPTAAGWSERDGCFLVVAPLCGGDFVLDVVNISKQPHLVHAVRVAWRLVGSEFACPQCDCKNSAILLQDVRVFVFVSVCWLPVLRFGSNTIEHMYIEATCTHACVCQVGV